MNLRNSLLPFAVAALASAPIEATFAQATATDAAPSVTAPASSDPQDATRDAAQPSGNDDGAGASTPSATSYSDDELKSFASSMVAVHRIRAVFGAKIAATDDADEQQQLAESAVNAMEAAVVQNGLSLDRFRDILNAAREDQSLVERINAQLGALGSAR